MTIQVSNSDSGLFRFIHDCGHPGISTMDRVTQLLNHLLDGITIFKRKRLSCKTYTLFGTWF